MKTILLSVSYDEQTIATLLVSLAVFVGVLLILRELMLWYWKVPVIIKELKSMNKLLHQVHGVEYKEEEKKEVEVKQE